MTKKPPSPFNLDLELIGLELLLNLTNISEESRDYLCDKHVQPASLFIIDEDGLDVPFENIFPPVASPESVVYSRIEPHTTELISQHTIEKSSDGYTLTWGEMKKYFLPPGKYKLFCRWNCFYNWKELPLPNTIKKIDPDQRWTGQVNSNTITLKLKP